MTDEGKAAAEKPRAFRASFYSWIIPRVTEIARERGYALGVHGSLGRDLDLVAVPWVDYAKSAEELIEAIRADLGGIIIESGTKGGRYNPTTGGFDEVIITNPSSKPHGRLAWNIHLECGAFLDVSVMPLAPPRDDGPVTIEFCVSLGGVHSEGPIVVFGNIEYDVNDGEVWHADSRLGYCTTRGQLLMLLEALGVQEKTK